MSFIRFNRDFKEYIWGGQCFNSKLSIDIPNNKNIAEIIEICDRDKYCSIAQNSKFKNLSLREILVKDSPYLIGKDFDENRRFPIIVKLLNSEQRLSLQVHPTQLTAKKTNSESKDEAWYFIETSKFSEIIAGNKPNSNIDKLLSDIKNSSIRESIISYKTKNGDFIMIKSGCLHSIGAGNIILEIQENSTTTFRIYDWNRIGLNGKKRQLHINESIDAIDFTLDAPKLLHTNSDKIQLLCKENKFSIYKYCLKAGECIEFKENQQVRLLSLVKGKIANNDETINTYDTVILPFAQYFNFKAIEDSEFIITEDFIL